MLPIRYPLRVVRILFLFLATTPALYAQMQLIIDSVIVAGFPIVKTKIRVLKDNVTVTGLNVSNFTILEDGKVQAPIQATCNDTIKSNPVSVMLLIDRSGSMAPPLGGLDAAKVAAKRFLDRLSGGDESALMSFGSIGFGSGISYDQSWTLNSTLVKNAIDQLVANGGTPLWRAVKTASIYTSTRSNKKVIIVLTDGADTESPVTTTLQDAINQAKGDGVTVFAIGLGNQIVTSDLTRLATQTGGAFYLAPSPGDLDRIYQQIATRITTSGICELIYTSKIDCWNGSSHTLEIVVTANGETARQSATFTVPVDSTTFSFVNLSMERQYVVESDSDIVIPVTLTRVSPNRPPKVFQFSVDFDPGILSLQSADTTALTRGYSATITPTGRGAELLLSGSGAVTTPGDLVLLHFHAWSADSSRKAEIGISRPDVQQFCTVATATNGLITVSGRCQRALSPDSKIQTTRISGNAPNPFNPSTKISFIVGKEGNTTLRLYDERGRELRVLLSRRMGAGEHSILFDGSACASGRYFIRLEAADGEDVRSILLLK